MTIVDSIAQRVHVIRAFILRDMRSRYGRSYVAYLVAILWPLTHLVGLTFLVSLMRGNTPLYGDETAVFIATGAIPYILVMYPSRLVSSTIDNNRSLFVFPVVRAIDMLIGRIIIEFLTASVVLALFFAGVSAFGFDIMPKDTQQAGLAILVTIYFSIAFGMLSAIIAALFRFWHVAMAVLMVGLYLTSGIFTPVSTMSSQFRDILWFNPLAHCVEWLRSSYYVGYGEGFISRGYIIWWANGMLFLALLGERFIRGKLFSQ